jgi:hypothetical protein
MVMRGRNGCGFPARLTAALRGRWVGALVALADRPAILSPRRQRMNSTAATEYVFKRVRVGIPRLSGFQSVRRRFQPVPAAVAGMIPRPSLAPLASVTYDSLKLRGTWTVVYG